MPQSHDVQTTTEPRRENGEQHRHEHEQELRELAARENIGQDLERIRDRVELALHEAHGADIKFWCRMALRSCGVRTLAPGAGSNWPWGLAPRSCAHPR